MYFIRRGFLQGIDKAFHAKESANLLLTDALDRAVCDDELLNRLAKHCQRFGISPNSGEVKTLIAQLYAIRPTLVQ